MDVPFEILSLLAHPGNDRAFDLGIAVGVLLAVGGYAEGRGNNSLDCS